MRQQGFGATRLLLDPLMAAPGKRAIPGKMMIALRLGYIDKLVARRVRPVERNETCCHCFCIAGFAEESNGGVRTRGQTGVFHRRNQPSIPTPAGNKAVPVRRSTIDIFRTGW